MAALLSWWILLQVLGLLALPLTFRLFGPAMAHGYPFARILFVLVWTYVAWLAGFVIPMSAALYGSLALLALAGLLGYALDPQLRAWVAGPGRGAMLRHDALWTAGFAFFAFQRSMVPDINGAEKYMDFAFLNALLHADSMPPPDPWLSGGTINYYYFGYLMFANLARIFPQPVYITYNLCIATIGGLAFSQTAAVVFGLTRRWGFALLGGALSAVLGNLDGAQQVLQKGALRGMDVWRSSRVVGRGDTINEFPFFSTIHGDLHPHFIVLPIAIVFLASLLDERLFAPRPAAPDAGAGALPRPAGMLFVTFLLAAMVGISTWELPLGAVALTLLAGRRIPFLPLIGRDRLTFAAMVAGALVLSYALFLPFYHYFDAPPSSPGFKVATTSYGQFLLVFGHLLYPAAVLFGLGVWRLQPFAGESRHLVIAAAVLVLVFAVMAGNAVLPTVGILLAGALLLAYVAEDDSADRAGYLLIAAALIALLACELVFLRDTYGEKLYRMNTVFKLYFQAWTMLAIAAPWCAWKVLANPETPAAVRSGFAAGLALLLAGTACYPIGVTADRLAWGRQHTLDGNEYLRQEHADDYAAIEWLRRNAAPRTVILEATGNPYSYYARFSSNTGLPTVMGWSNHEGLWRARDHEVGKRHSDVRRIYDAADLASVRPLLEHYQVRYVIVGELEHKDHAAGVGKFKELPRVFESGRTAIYEVR